MNWKLERPKAAMPNSYFWTWDHRANWTLDDPGCLDFGCNNKYMKRPETFVEDYRRLTDFCAELGIKGIAIWGFLRDSHGGVENAKRVADYAAGKGVAVLPGVGVTWYGGVYYEGEHKYNLETFTRKNPDARFIDKSGEPEPRGVCPSHPAYGEWIAEGLEWLFREFKIGGVNLENGDFLVCRCPRCRDRLEALPPDEPDFFKAQFLGYEPVLRRLAGRSQETTITWAAYTGFMPGKCPPQPDLENKGSDGYLMCDRPRMLDLLPPESIAQWTGTFMLRREPLPLLAYLDDGAPAAAFDNPRWPAGLMAPAARNTAYMHFGWPWTDWNRVDLYVSSIKEFCLRAFRSGCEGVSMYGEVTARNIPNALNYLAFSHFIHWPEDSMREFGRKTLGQILGSEQAGESFAVCLAHCLAGSLTDGMKDEIETRASSLKKDVAHGARDALEPWRFWTWMRAMKWGFAEKHTSSWF